jgi:adenine-specific DNA-methyltransferase
VNASKAHPCDACSPRDERELIGIAIALGAERVGRLSDRELETSETATRVDDTRVAVFHDAIARGEDPLGDALCALRSPTARRPMGATYTPPAIVAAMTQWGAARSPARVVDPGAGSGRFVVAAGRALTHAELVAVEIDPVAALLTRAHVASAKLGDRARIVVDDYREIALPRITGTTLFLGNPPYVRHHAIDARWKKWLRETARTIGLEASALAGLHAHFFLATAAHAQRGDMGSFVTAAEWLDVNYGSVVRQLLTGPLGGESVHLVEPTALPFDDATTTAVIACFAVGERSPTMRVRRVASVDALVPLDGRGGRDVTRETLMGATRWTPFTRAARGRAGARHARRDFVELGELCRVHRGQVTGANRVWIAGAHSEGLPEDVLFACVTKARELFEAQASKGGFVDVRRLRRVIDLPANLDELASDARRAVERFLRTARTMNADKGFIAQHRRAWWSIGLRDPAPILATYMARRSPAFVRNVHGARNINIAHGLYPREPMDDAQLDLLARVLSEGTSLDDGRTYAGGLTKFEPKEMERLLVPTPSLLTLGSSDRASLGPLGVLSRADRCRASSPPSPSSSSSPSSPRAATRREAFKGSTSPTKGA